MTAPNDKDLRELLHQAISPARHTELRRDLWPDMLRRLDRESLHAAGMAPAFHFHVPWFDWALAALVSATLLFFPGAIPALLYHL